MVLATGTTAMTVYVREANLVDDQAILTDVAQKYLAGDADEKRFHWLYQESPFGPARAWIACDKQGEAVGMAAVFPRRMFCDGIVVSGCVLGDLCVSPQYRSLGPALQLQRACLGCVQSGDFALAYDFPSTTMVGIYQHLGFRPACKSVRWVKPLRADGIARVLPGPILSRPVTAAANLALALRDGFVSDPRGVDFCLEDSPCTSEYTLLANKVGASLGTCTVRTAEYLNWRYRQHPLVKYEFLTARLGPELLAYCVFTITAGDVTIAELFGNRENDRAIITLMQKLVVLLRSRGVVTISMPLLSCDSRNALLRKLGFWARETVPVMFLGREASNLGSRMLLMHGDRES
jgi:GNAT superfamily N-acetyltransferase